MFKKNKKPEVVVVDGEFYVQLIAVRRLIKKIGKQFLDHHKEEFERYMQEMLDNGYDINVRNSRKAFKATEKEFERLLHIIDDILKDSEEETITEDNRVKKDGTR